ncbi:hypothetical protein CLIB1444_06S01992 [[Candida] jaroonii]|uniref:Uncharacterized protein n=1 Tax=[Candida] jaroonii TaxID=467808 RepID=A0ACA9Y9R4_9ASCO|nr:hypothetical protein CLIB1444_06S01992 [[Candida] jaroonii]
MIDHNVIESYTKIVDDKLSIELIYTKKNDELVNCNLKFHNISNSRMIINETTDQNNNQSESWLSGIWGSKDESVPLKRPETPDVKLFLGYIQLFGYVVLNYKFGLDEPKNMTISDKAPRNAAWWLNKEYLEMYADSDDDTFERDIALDSTPFILDNIVEPMVVGGKLGGVNDLIVEEDGSSSITLDSSKRYFLHDLILNFNSYKRPRPHEVENDGRVELKELSDSILPFYSTSQSLLFSDLIIDPSSTKEFSFSFPNVEDLPPSYNTNSTGITTEQGLISIRYSMILGFSKLDQFKNLSPVSIYYPFTVKAEKKGQDERWFQPNYLQHITIDKSWKINIDEKNDIQSNGNDLKLDGREIKDTRESFLTDLKKLIDSDLHNIPKMSTTERKKSFQSLHDPEDIKPGLVPQLPPHLKNQYQILVNNNQLCLVTISKPYYHLGEDLSFTIDLNTENPPEKQAAKISGVTVHLEAHEIFHLKDTKKITNIYRVSQNVKLNSFSPSMLNSVIINNEQNPCLLNGYLHIANSLTQQFQSSKLMDLKYFVVFKFNMLHFDKHKNVNSHDATPQNGHTRGGAEFEANNSGGTQNETNGESSNAETNVADTELLMESLNIGEFNTAKSYEFINNYKFNNPGNDFTFRIPIVILP